MALFSMLAISIAVSGCGGRDDSSGYLRSFESIVGEALELYGEIHPLRSSRLGITGSDSLLFTFSADEIDYCGARCDSLLERISRLPANHFGARAIDDSAILIDWLGGNSSRCGNFAPGKRTPCSIAGWPRRPSSGYRPGSRRPERVNCAPTSAASAAFPALLENAGLNLRDPPAIQIEPSLERIGAILEKAGELRAVLKLRYGTLPASFDEAVKSVESFGDYLRGALASGTQGATSWARKRSRTSCFIPSTSTWISTSSPPRRRNRSGRTWGRSPPSNEAAPRARGRPRKMTFPRCRP